MEKIYEVFLDNGNGQYEFEGVFTSLREVSLYLEIPKGVVDAIASGDYDAIDDQYENIVINRVFVGPKEFQSNYFRGGPAKDNKNEVLQ